MTRAGRARVGVVVDVPGELGALIAQWRRKLGDPLAEAIAPHVTVVPPVQLAVDELPAAQALVARAAAAVPPFEVHLRGTGTFRPVSPVVFVALAAGISEFERLAAGARHGVLSAPRQFPYHPHVTVLHDAEDARLDQAYDALADVDGRFTASTVLLYRHTHDGTPAGLWVPEAAFPLG